MRQRAVSPSSNGKGSAGAEEQPAYSPSIRNAPLSPPRIEIEDFEVRRDEIVALLEGVLQKYQTPEDPSNASLLTYVLRGVARELAAIWDSTPRSTRDKEIIAETTRTNKLTIAKVARIKKLTSALFERGSVGQAGLSGEMLLALYSVATANIYSEYPLPKRGAKENLAALHLAEVFRSFYPKLTNKRIGSNVDHDFVQTLGDIYRKLGFEEIPVNQDLYKRANIKMKKIL